jgi:hypothetical protein
MVKNRRTIYQLQKESTISDKEIQNIIQQAILHVPSSWNSQSTRVLLLLGEDHDKLWEIAKEVLKKIVPTRRYSITEQKLNSFKMGYGTVSYPFPFILPYVNSIVVALMSRMRRFCFLIAVPPSQLCKRIFRDTPTASLHGPPNPVRLFPSVVQLRYFLSHILYISAYFITHFLCLLLCISIS